MSNADVNQLESMLDDPGMDDPRMLPPSRHRGGGGSYAAPEQSRGRAGESPSSPKKANKQTPPLNFKREHKKAPAIGGVLLFFGFLLWVVNAEYTAQGIISFSNLILDWFNISISFGRLEAVYSLPLGVIVGYFVTQAQIRELPLQYKNGVVEWIGVGAIIGWVFISGFDVVTTAQGFVTLPDDAWDIHRQAASSSFVTGVYSLVLSFFPEFMIMAGWALTGLPVPAMFKRG